MEKSKKRAILASAGLAACCYAVLNYIRKKAKGGGAEKKPRGQKAEGRLISGGDKKESAYEKSVKPALDKALAFVGLLILAPLYAGISAAVFVDDPGPVLFTQERIGKGGGGVYLHKFRSMKVKTPHDVPTHQLKDPEQYITRVGKFLRKYSLDELPQVWDILIGNMSIIGPRPALWNQDDLIAERDKYGANGVKPGLTGWAQVNGRDELEIAEKARLDGEYVKQLRQGGIKALLFDMRCFFRTVFAVLGSRGVIEGGTGELDRKGRRPQKGGVKKDGEAEGNQRNSRVEARWQAGKVKGTDKPGTVDESGAGFEDYGCRKHFVIDTSERNKKKVLVTGAGSYVGESFEKWAKKRYSGNFKIDTLDMRDPFWKEKDFSSYDAVFHVAGIAHADVGGATEEEKKRYYEVNTGLAIETAEKAKADGVKQFVFMSSMIIYGDSVPYGREKVIDEHTVPAPSNFYGDSKWQADKGVRALADGAFHVAVLRAPMVYGRGSKGNYPVLVKLAKKLPVFPDVENRRSMLYIDNLCEFLCKLMLSGEGGTYFPQNGEYTKTSEMVKEIAEVAGKKIWVTKLMNPAVWIGSHISGKISRLVDKAFGNNIYSWRLSQYEGMDYQLISLGDSVERASYESRAFKGNEKKQSVLILVNHDVVIYNFRRELVEELLADEYEVHISSPKGEHTQDLIALGAHFHEIKIDRHGMNPIDDLHIFIEYRRLIEAISPVVVLAYTIKPNVYGGIAARMKHIPFIANITGLGTTVNGGGIKEALVLLLYRFGLYGAKKVFFQNEENKNYMLEKHVISCPCKVIPGSGVNLETHSFEPYPEETDKLIFSTIGRIMGDKGTDELLFAAERIKKKYPLTIFRLIGFFDDDYETKVKKAERGGIIEYIEQQRDIHPWMRDSHAIIHPSYHEGMSNVLLEAAATGRPVLASDIPGCREAFDEGISGLGVRPRDSIALERTIEKFIQLSYKEKAAMGMAGRKKVEQEFNRDIVVKNYLYEIRKLSVENKEKICAE